MSDKKSNIYSKIAEIEKQDAKLNKNKKKNTSTSEEDESSDEDTFEKYRSGKSKKGRMTGTVTSVKNYGNETFRINSNKGDKYLVYHEGYKKYCPIRPGDIVSFKCKAYIETNFAETRSMVTVMLGCDIGSFVSILKASSETTKLKEVEIYALYDKLIEMCKTFGGGRFEYPHDIMTYAAQAYRDNAQANMVLILSRLTYNIGNVSLPIFVKGVKQVKDLLTFWENSRDMRKLYCIGLTRTNIEACLDSNQLNLTTLYERMLKNPYTFACLETKTCMRVDLHTLRKEGENDIECHTIIRHLYKDVMVRRWNYTPLRHLLQKFRSINRLKKLLIAEYECVFETVPIYHPKDFPSSSSSSSSSSTEDSDNSKDSKSKISKKREHYPTGEEECVYLKYIRDIEIDVVQYIAKLVTDPPYLKLKPPIYIDSKLDDDQKNMVNMALTNNFSLATGPAGSGKTTTVRTITYNLDQNDNVKCAITSFTGKAVIRVKQMGGIGNRAATTHRMIHGRAENIDFNYVIWDEATMTYMRLFWWFIRAFPHQFAILMVGDINQLSPIDWGSLFEACMMCRSIPRTILTSIHRVVTKDGTRDGIILNSSNIVTWPKGVQFIFEETDNFIVENCKPSYIISVLNDLKKQEYTLDDVKILCPYAIKKSKKKNEPSAHCLQEISDMCQKFWNRREKFIEAKDGRKWYVNDIVIMLVNNYDLDVMNGQEGRVVELDEEDEEYIIVNFPYVEVVEINRDLVLPQTSKYKTEIQSTKDLDNGYKLVTISKLVKVNLPKEKRSMLTDEERNKMKDRDGNVKLKTITTDFIQHSYVITAHKSQGSEWKVGITYIPRTASLKGSFLNRSIIYVMITRSSEKGYVLGDRMVASMAISKELPYRADMTCDRLKVLLPRLYKYTEFKFSDENEYNEEFDSFDDYYNEDAFDF